MLFPIHMTLMSLGVLFLVAQSFVWSTSLVVLGTGSFLLAFVSLFFDPTLFLFI